MHCVSGAEAHRAIDRVVDVRLGCDVDNNLDLLSADFVEEAGRHGVVEIEAIGLDEMEDARVPQPIESFGRI